MKKKEIKYILITLGCLFVISLYLKFTSGINTTQSKISEVKTTNSWDNKSLNMDERIVLFTTDYIKKELSTFGGNKMYGGTRDILEVYNPTNKTINRTDTGDYRYVFYYSTWSIDYKYMFDGEMMIDFYIKENRFDKMDDEIVTDGTMSMYNTLTKSSRKIPFDYKWYGREPR